MIVAEDYGQFKLDESLIKLQPFRKMTSPRKPAITPAPPKEAKSPSFKKFLVETGQGLLSVALAKYLGMTPKPAGTTTAEVTPRTRPTTTVAAVSPTRIGRPPKISLGLTFLIGGALFAISALLLFRRK